MAPPSSDLERVRSLNRQIKKRLAEVAPPDDLSGASRLTYIMTRSNEIRKELEAPEISCEEARKFLDEGNTLWWEADKLVSEVEGFPAPDDLEVARTYREGRAKGGVFTI